MNNSVGTTVPSPSAEHGPQVWWCLHSSWHQLGLSSPSCVLPAVATAPAAELQFQVPSFLSLSLFFSSKPSQDKVRSKPACPCAWFTSSLSSAPIPPLRPHWGRQLGGPLCLTRFFSRDFIYPFNCSAPCSCTVHPPLRRGPSHSHAQSHTLLPVSILVPISSF